MGRIQVSEEDRRVTIQNAVPDIDWIITEAVTVRKIDETYLVTEKGGERRACIMRFDDNGRLLFDGVDIETEDFMAYVGLIDMVNDGVTGFEAEEE
jgi:hypothetical protein